MLLYDRWREIVAEHGDAPALWDVPSGRKWTFRQLHAEAEGAPQPARSERVVFAQSTGSNFIFSTLAAWRAGLVLCPLEVGQPRPVFTTPLPEGIVHLKTTSATTGAPRFVAFKPRQLAADAHNIVETMGLRRDWPNLGVISLAHSYGFSNLVLPLLLHGVPLVLAGSGLPEALRAAAAVADSCTLAAVPALYRTWHEGEVLPANTRLAISAGAPLPVALEQSVFERAGLKIHNFYGSSECGGIAYDGSSVPRRDAACVGAPMANVDVSVGGDGCVEVRGAAVGETYWPDPDPKLGSGVFRTEDQGEILDGRVYLRGRASDTINIAGRKVPPEAIERVLAADPQVRACVVFGIPAAELGRGEKIVACIALGSPAHLPTLKRHAAEQLPEWQVPREWWVTDELRHNARGKISRAEWRARYLQAKKRKNGTGRPRP